ncbi:hypothetical protein X750_30305 [Mesorhizobium sp. LNJC394B00]|nr:hypothetical protein X750_30305 [Mesorhizobium sp. LNJC394B00]
MPAICMARVHLCTPMSAQRHKTDKADGLGTAM